MERGKQICRILKDIRRQIAEENEIELVTSECRHKGDCAGTCPKCEAEVRYLESQLARRRYLGRSVRLTGVSLGLAAIAPALVSCDPALTGDPVLPQIHGDVPLLPGDPEVPDNVTLGENLVFDLIPQEVFMKAFSQGGWREVEVYDVYPEGKLGEEILRNIAGYTPRKYAVKSDDTIKEYIGFNSDPERFDYRIHNFVYLWQSNSLIIGTDGKETIFTVASINENEMVCYGSVFSPHWTPEAFLGKYVFKRASAEAVEEWDEKYTSEYTE